DSGLILSLRVGKHIDDGNGPFSGKLFQLDLAS
ncbi:MAG: hypothetical protein RLZZ490_1058, partial [Cyanobacteriota bacterium]